MSIGEEWEFTITHTELENRIAKRTAELQANIRDEKIKVARLQMIAYGAVDEEYAAYYNLSLQGEPTEKHDG